MEFIPKFINDIINTYSIENVITWLKEMCLFVLKPKKFISIYHSKKINGQINQLIFYSLVLIFVYFTFDYGSNSQEFYKLLFIVFFISLPFILINCASFSILLNSSFKFWNIFSFVYLAWLIFFIPSLILSYCFIRTENYTFYFLSNVFTLLGTIYSLFIVWNIFSNSILKIISGYILNILCLNIMFLLLAIIVRDSHSNVTDMDPIINENDYFMGEIKNFAGEPYSYIQEINYKEKSIKNYIGFIDNEIGRAHV